MSPSTSPPSLSLLRPPPQQLLPLTLIFWMSFPLCRYLYVYPLALGRLVFRIPHPWPRWLGRRQAVLGRLVLRLPHPRLHRLGRLWPPLDLAPDHLRLPHLLGLRLGHRSNHLHRLLRLVPLHSLWTPGAGLGPTSALPVCLGHSTSILVSLSALYLLRQSTTFMACALGLRVGFGNLA
jgi:hypothetical protein